VYFFYSRTVHPDIIKCFIYPTECTTRLKFTLKFTAHTRTNRTGQLRSHTTALNSQRRILINITLAKQSKAKLTDDGFVNRNM